MLDAFLEAVCNQTKQAEARDRSMQLLARLPTTELRKIAYGAPMAIKAAGDECWLERFQGTPLYEQALQLEKDELDIQMEEQHRRQMECELRASLPSWDETELRRDDLRVKRKLLELELAGADVGGQEGEDVEAALPEPEAEGDLPIPEAAEAAPEAEGPPPAAPPSAAKAGPAGPPGPPPPTAAAAEEEPAEEESGEEEGPPAPPPPAAKAEGGGEDKPKPKTEKTTTTVKEKPVEDKEKIDIKAASAAMRMSFLVERMKEAQPASRAGAFRRR